jgi:hypothetical protein
MKKKLILTFVLSAAAGSALLLGAETPVILNPKPPAAQAGAQGGTVEPKARRGPRLAPGNVLQVRGKIVKVYPADAARKRAGWIVLLVGGKRLSVVVSDSATVKDGKGARLSPGLLKAGETVSMSYRQRGKTRTALRIRA